MAISTDSLSLFRFHLLRNIQIITISIFLVCRLKCPYSRFSSDFCLPTFMIFVLLLVIKLFLLILLLLVAFISINPFFIYFFRVTELFDSHNLQCCRVILLFFSLSLRICQCNLSDRRMCNVIKFLVLHLFLWSDFHCRLCFPCSYEVFLPEFFFHLPLLINARF